MFDDGGQLDVAHGILLNLYVLNELSFFGVPALQYNVYL